MSTDQLSSQAGGGPCRTCNGTGGGLIPCTACNATGRSSQETPGWLAGWTLAGRPIELIRALVVVGLDPPDEAAVVRTALSPQATGAKCYVSTDPGLAALNEEPALHYDPTGDCRAPHHHVLWDPAMPTVDDTSAAAAQLIAALESEFTPLPGASFEDITSLVGPDTIKTLPVASLALWTAGASGQGTLAAVEWLAAGQLPQMLAYCRPLGDRMGRGRLPLFDSVAELLAGPRQEWVTVVSRAVAALNIAGDTLRNGYGHATRLHPAGWVTSSGLLAVTLPADRAEPRHLVTALMAAAESGARASTQQAIDAATVVWHRTGAPHAGNGSLKLAMMSKPWLVVTGGEEFPEWELDAADPRWIHPDWVIGPGAPPSAWGVVRRRLAGASHELPGPGQALMVRSQSPAGGPGFAAIISRDDRGSRASV